MILIYNPSHDKSKKKKINSRKKNNYMILIYNASHDKNKQ